MKKIDFSLIFIIILFFSTEIMAQERKTINFAIEETPPYAFLENKKILGILPDIVQAVYKESQYALSIQILPPKRSSLWAEKGIIDGIIGVANDTILFEGEVFSDILLKITINPIVLKETTISYKTIEDIKPYRVGIVAGVGFENLFPDLNFETVSYAKLNIEKLLGKRFDIILDDPVISDYIVRKKDLKNKNRIKALSPPLKVIDLVIGFSSAVIDHKKKYKDFNKGLAVIKGNGIYDNILKKWNINN